METKICGMPIVGWVVFYEDEAGCDTQTFDTKLEAEAFALDFPRTAIYPVTEY